MASLSAGFFVCKSGGFRVHRAEGKDISNVIRTIALRLFKARLRPVLIDAHRRQHFFCWYCAGQLPNNFTSVEKNGCPLRVHYGCRPQAAELIAGMQIEDQLDTWVKPLDYDELPV